MSAESISTIVASGCAVLASVFSVLALSFRVGKLVGIVEGFMKASDADRQSLHAENNAIEAKLDRHIDQHVRTTRNR